MNKGQRSKPTQILDNFQHSKTFSSSRHRCTESHTDAQGRKTKLFRLLPGEVERTSETFQKNESASKMTIEKYEQVLSLATGLGGEKAIDRHVNKNKKTLVTDRLRMLFDDVDDMLEIGAFAGIGMQYGNIPRAGIFGGN